MKAFEIKQDLYWVGGLDPDLRVFDVIMHTATGTTYNSYLIKDEKIAVVEAVKEKYYDEWLARLADAGVQPQDIDYLVLDHTEPDHTGAVRKLIEIAPHVKIVCSRPAATLIREITNADLDIQIVGDGDAIPLGSKDLQFIAAPFLHWPDTMFTYIPQQQALISGDVFGFHHCCTGIFDDSESMEKLRDAQKYYFDVIMRPFKAYALQACERVRGMEIDVICPSHGPVLREDPWDAVNRYAAWSQPDEKIGKRAFVGYVSCYGYTAEIAKAIADECKNLGLHVTLADIAEKGADACAAMAMDADIILLGSPTVNRDALPPVWNLLTGLSAIRTRGKVGAAFGSFGWSGEASGFILQRMEQVGIKTVGSVRGKMFPSQQTLEEARALAVKAAEEAK